MTAGRHGGRPGGTSRGLDWELPVPGAPSLEERLRSGDLPVGLTAEEVERALPKRFDGKAATTKIAYEKFARYFEKWCVSRGIALDQVETAHLRVYMEDARARRPRPVSASWLYSTLAGVRLSMRFEGLSGRVSWRELSAFVYDERMEKKDSPCRLTPSLGR